MVDITAFNSDTWKLVNEAIGYSSICNNAGLGMFFNYSADLKQDTVDEPGRYSKCFNEKDDNSRLRSKLTSIFDKSLLDDTIIRCVDVQELSLDAQEFISTLSIKDSGTKLNMYFLENTGPVDVVLKRARGYCTKLNGVSLNAGSEIEITDRFAIYNGEYWSVAFTSSSYKVAIGVETSQDGIKGRGDVVVYEIKDRLLYKAVLSDNPRFSDALNFFRG